MMTLLQEKHILIKNNLVSRFWFPKTVIMDKSGNIGMYHTGMAD